MTLPDRLYHTAPLHYLPRIVHCGALYAQSVLVAGGIAPRATACRRDRMLGLADYVHLSFRAATPLLADKLPKGYPHALLVFPVAPVLELPATALLPGNAKAWRTRAALTPVTDPDERAALLRRHVTTGRFPSLEALVKYGLSLELLERIAFFTAEEHNAVAQTLAAVGLTPSAPLTVNPSLFPPCACYAPITLEETKDYFARCCAARELLPPPNIPFD